MVSRRHQPLSDGAAVMGSTSNLLTLVNVLGADGGAYTVVVSNLAGVSDQHAAGGVDGD